MLKGVWEGGKTKQVLCFVVCLHLRKDGEDIGDLKDQPQADSKEDTSCVPKRKSSSFPNHSWEVVAWFIDCWACLDIWVPDARRKGLLFGKMFCFAEEHLQNFGRTELDLTVVPGRNYFFFVRVLLALANPKSVDFSGCLVSPNPILCCLMRGHRASEDQLDFWQIVLCLVKQASMSPIFSHLCAPPPHTHLPSCLAL